MSTTMNRISRYARCAAIFGLLAGFTVIGVTAGQDVQEQKKDQPAEPAKDKRLQELQTQVDELKKQIESLRTRPASLPATKKSSPTTKKPAEEKVDESTAQAAERVEKQPAASSPAVAASAAAAPTNAKTFTPDWFKSLTWRCVGPAAMGGRVVDIAVVDSDPCCFYVATASGGLFKTMNNGITFTPMFDHENTVAIGDVAVAPSNPEILWVGTGEHNPRNSVSWGDGVYKSTDGGDKWTNMGLKDSYQIGRIAIHPRNPDIVYVGALGRLWGENEERGVFKTIDGGKTWEKVLFVDAKTGCIDLVLNPDDPEQIIAAMYERQRGIYDDGDPVKRWGPGSGLYKSVNGGKDWRKLTTGLPTVQMGRIGVTHFKKDPKIVYAIIETEKIATGPRHEQQGSPAYMGINGEGDEGGAKLTTVTAGGPADIAGIESGDTVVEIDGKAIASYADLTGQIQSHKAGDKVKVKFLRGGTPNEVELTFAERPATGGGGGRGSTPANPFAQSLGGQRENMQDRQGADGFQTGGVFKSTDGGDSWTRVNSLNPRPFYYSQIVVDPNDADKVYVLGVSSYRSTDGGKSFGGNLASGVHADTHALWIDPRDGRHMILGGDGGLYVSHDRGGRWEHVNIMPLGQFYHVAVDTRRPYNVYGGLQDNGSWGGPSMTRGRGGPTNEDWITVGSGDGFTCQVDPLDPDLVYYTSQYGRMGRINVRTGERRSIQPRSTPTQSASEGLPTEARSASEGQTTGTRSVSEGQTGAQSSPRYRFNWKTPFVLSHHNSKLFYAAGNFVFKSLDRGDNLRVISPEVSATSKGTASALAESPVNPDVLYVGTDDGNLWVTQNGGHDWTNITENIKGVPAKGCVATIEASRHHEGRCYIAIDAHRADNTAPHALVTEDFGKTWTSLRANLPDGSARTLREDIQNEKLLYLGTEFGAWISLDRGNYWIKLNNNLPTVAVHEFAQPRTANELVAATHGRSIWIFDITPIRQMTDDVQKATVHLFKPQPAVVWGTSLSRSLYGHKRYVGENPTDGAPIHFMLHEPAKEISLKVVDAEGKTVRELPAKKDAGLQRVVWDLRRFADSSQRPAGDSPGQRGGTGSRSGGGNRAGQSAASGSSQGSSGIPSRAQPGQYRLVLAVDGKELTQTILIEADPQLPASLIGEAEDIQIDWD
jgi:photosystem II stability/assembly factor-like uncharacterized protein